MPLISIITPVYDTPEPVLRAMVDSVRSQSFTDWELCLVDDCSPSSRPREVLAEYAAQDPRIRVETRTENGGIVAASNDALAMARGEFVSFLDHDDELYPGALERTVEALRSDPEVDYVYTDEDKLDEDGRRRSPFHKPDWSPERFRYQMYSCHFATMRRTLVEEVGGFRPDFEGSQDFDLVFRVTERARRIVHIPEVLYGWRIIAGSAAGDVNAKPYAWLAGQRAIQSHCDRVGFEAEVAHDMAQPGWYRLRPRLTEQPPVSIVIPTNGNSAVVHGERVSLVVNCVRSIVEHSTYGNYEIVVVADSVTSDATLDELRSAGAPELTVVPFDKPFNFSEKINVGAVRSSGDHLMLLNDDTEVISSDWLESMLMYSRFDRIGAVGPKLLFEDGRIQHAGIALSAESSGPIHLYRGFPRHHPGHFSAVRLSLNLLGVTGACMMTSRTAFDEVGGYSERFPLNYNDIDYCLKLHDAGLRVAYDPEVELYHYESMSRDPVVTPLEDLEFRNRWGRFLGNDPYCSSELYHGSLGQNISGDYGIGLDRPAVRLA
jgi:O-antigen biosynthesis protein